MEQDRIDEKVAGRFLEVRQQIAEAAKRSGRSENAVRLVAVTKYADCESGIVQAFLKTGCRDFGESRPQRLLEKMDFFSPEQVSGPPVRWHMIGPLQRNKIRRILNRVALIHSVDSLKLIEAIQRIMEEETEMIAAEQEKKQSENFAFRIPDQVSVLLEVNISGDLNKQGFEASDLLKQLPQLLSFPRVRVCGLMGMGGLESSMDEVRRQFASLRMLRDEIHRRLGADCPIQELSMGMSHDFVVAIEEGATIVRVGSALYA